MKVKSLHKGKPLVSEHAIQAAYFDWVRLKAKTDWRYKLIYAIPNSRFTKMGRIYGWREGLLAGMLDVCIPHHKWDKENHKDWWAAYIEFKTLTGKVSKRQRDVHDWLGMAGNCVTVIYSLDEAIKFTTWYLE